jgi:Holliday junction resolvase RusA-like endonuclease
MITFEVPGDPRGKQRPRFSRKSGRAYTPAETVNYEALIKLSARQQMQDLPPTEAAVVIAIDVACPIPQSFSKKKRASALAGEIYPTTKPDIDNIAKIVADALNAIVWKDDKQIVRALLAKHYSERPHLRVSVSAA